MTSAAAFVLLTRMHEHYMFYSLVNTVVALTIAWFGVRWVEGDREMTFFSLPRLRRAQLSGARPSTSAGMSAS